MRKNMNKICSLYPLILSFAFIVAGCSTTPQSENTDEVANSDTQQVAENEVDKDLPSTTVYEVDNSEDVHVDDLPTSPADNEVSIKASAPQEYIVKQGDTLWDISSQFLNQPWFWPEIWYMNPQVQNPHLIYPGDIINVFYVGGKPYLTVNGENRVSGIERLSPVMRGEPLDANEKVIPIQAIEQFLNRPLVVDATELEKSPHIVASRDNRIIYGSNDIVYIRDSENLEMDALYNVYRPGTTFEDPETGEILGYEAIHVGNGKITRDGEPATLYITEAVREILRGDRVLKIDNVDVDSALRPRSPDNEVNGRVIYLYDALTQSGTFQVIAINLGVQHGIEKGHVLAINKSGRTVTDPYAEE